jgi:NTP pyrophosphatase (non-canonical NTP hydrolase)
LGIPGPAVRDFSRNFLFFAGLLSEVLEGLLSTTESNWEELDKELAEML